MVGVGAIKYADLSTDRTRDYVFDWDRMLAFEGNTAPYLQYARARIHSIFRRGQVEVTDVAELPTLSEPSERALALALIGFAAVLHATLESYSPSKLCAYSVRPGLDLHDVLREVSDSEGPHGRVTSEPPFAGRAHRQRPRERPRPARDLLIHNTCSAQKRPLSRSTPSASAA